MPQIATDLIGRPTGMYDSQHPDQVDLDIVHAVDITDVCPNTPECRKLLKFTKATEGVIVQIAVCYEGEKEMGATVHYPLWVFEGGLRRTSLLANFYWYAEIFGITPECLLELIHEHAPKG